LAIDGVQESLEQSERILGELTRLDDVGCQKGNAVLAVYLSD
jgi:hypothetical protein